MKRILWFSNCIQSKGQNKASGSWLFSMAKLLVSTGNIHLVNITKSRNKNIHDIEHAIISEHFEEYILPDWDTDNNGLPSNGNCNLVKELCNTINPDIIHVWGVENYFSTMLPTLGLSAPLLLEIQGLQKPCSEVYYGDMTPTDILNCFGLREILFPFKKSICHFKKDMANKGVIENETIRRYTHISTQSAWIRERIQIINRKATIYKTGMSIREEFWNAKKWEYPSSINFYCSAAGPAPYKCIQTAIKALKTVSQYYPDARLYVIGNFVDQNWLHQPGYLTFLKKIIKKLELSDNVIFTGPLSANEIIDVMYKCIGMVQTSYVESYSLAVAEAQAVGVPSIISYAGAMPELAEHYKSGIYFSPGDYVSCANKMIELIENRQLAESISNEAYRLAKERNNDSIVVSTQLHIYDKVIS